MKRRRVQGGYRWGRVRKNLGRIGSWWALIVLFLGNASVAQADGGTIRLQAQQGLFRITVFTAPEILRPGPIDVSVLVQRADTSAVDFGANVELRLLPPAGVVLPAVDPFCGPNGEAWSRQWTNTLESTRSTQVQANRREATNKFLQAARLYPSVPGHWRLEVQIQRAGSQEVFLCELPIVSGANSSTPVVLVLALPPLFIFLFAAHQTLSRRRLAVGTISH